MGCAVPLSVKGACVRIKGRWQSANPVGLLGDVFHQQCRSGLSDKWGMDCAFQTTQKIFHSAQLFAVGRL